MIVIGTDTHKRTHTLSAVDEGTGKVRGHRQIDADEPGTWPRSNGRAGSMMSGCGRSRTAGRSRAGSMEPVGENAMIVLEDADIGKAVGGAERALLSNAGQLCIAIEPSARRRQHRMRPRLAVDAMRRQLVTGPIDPSPAALDSVTETIWYPNRVPYRRMSGRVRRQGTPFPFEGPVPPELLIDREDELALVGRRAGDRVDVRLVAPRRYGKTSLLLAHAAQLQQVGWRTVHVDLYGIADYPDVARRVATAYGHLDAPWMRSHLSG